MILTELKRATWPQHARLERGLGLPGSIGSREEYLALIRRFLGYYAPVETVLATVLAGAMPEFDFIRRRKTPLLLKDLRLLSGATIAETDVAWCADIPSVDDAPSALGCLYVLEGATLGGQIIARDLVRRFGLDATSGGAFFASYGDHVGMMWRAFGSTLSEGVHDEAAGARAIRGACETFATMERWLLPQEAEDERDERDERDAAQEEARGDWRTQGAQL